MRMLQERNLQVSIDGEVDARKFDDARSHGLSHCMKAVDFIIEFPDHYLFLEFKDPRHPDAPKHNRDKFIREFTGGSLDQELQYKCRDSFLYEWASGRADKPVRYFVLVADEALSDAELTVRTDALTRVLPIKVPNSVLWTKPLFQSCVVFNIESWNRSLPQYPLKRA